MNMLLINNTQIHSLIDQTLLDEYALGQSVEPPKYHAMIIHRDKIEELKSQMNVYPSDLFTGSAS